MSNTEVLISSNEDSPLTHIFHYLRFGVFAFSCLISVFAIMAGPVWVVMVFFVFAAVLGGGDLFSGEDEEIHEYKYPQLFYLGQYLTIPVIYANVFLLAWLTGLPGDTFGFAAWLKLNTTIDLMAIHATVGWPTHYLMLILSSLLVGLWGALAAVVVGHELTHRTGQPFNMFVGRLGQAMALFTYFSIEHPYGHHNTVCTSADAATAVRGESFWHFLPRSIIGQYRNCWRLEKQRCEKIGKSHWGFSNRLMQGYLMEAVIVAFFAYAGGLVGIISLLVVALVAHSILEMANYIEHYGLVRNPSEPVQPRHSWNSNNKITYWYTVGISRHSHHHADADIEFWNLRPMPEAPKCPSGYFATMILATAPRFWHQIMTPKLLEWDAHWATEKEKELAAQASEISGIPALEEAARKYRAEKEQTVLENN